MVLINIGENNNFYGFLARTTKISHLCEKSLHLRADGNFFFKFELSFSIGKNFRLFLNPTKNNYLLFFNLKFATLS